MGTSYSGRSHDNTPLQAQENSYHSHSWQDWVYCQDEIRGSEDFELLGPGEAPRPLTGLHAPSGSHPRLLFSPIFHIFPRSPLALKGVLIWKQLRWSYPQDVINAECLTKLLNCPES